MLMSFSENEKVLKTNQITRTIIDSESGEKLVGVKIISNNKISYTDFDGKFTLDSNIKTYKLEYISYRDTLISNSSEIIKMKDI